MKHATFFGQIQHDGNKATLISSDGGDFAQMIWEILGGQLKQVAPGKLAGSLYVRANFCEDDKGKDRTRVARFFAHLMPLIHKGMVDCGNDWDEKRSYMEVKQMFLEPGKNGEYTIKHLGDTAFKEFYEKVERFGVQYLGVDIEANKKKSNKYFPIEER